MQSIIPLVEQPAVEQPIAEQPIAEQPTAERTRNSKAPRKPRSLRPVKPPRGTSRPRKAAPTSVRPPIAASKRKPFKRRLLSKLMTLGAMVGAGLMMVSTSLPANAFYSGNDQYAAEGAVTAPAEAKVQALMAQPEAALSVVRDGYTTTSFREQIFLRYGNRNFFYTNDPNGTIQWPFAIAVPISDGYGPRVAPCPGCSTFHHGVDFTPGLGAHIQAIADGVVIGVDDLDWSFGEHVLIAHVINGVHIESLYAHMEVGSIKVKVGQQVKVGDELGLVGSTGESTGPHLHLEIHINGVPVDPFAWLKANAN